MPSPHYAPAALTRPLTIKEYAALGETQCGYTELIELYAQLREQIPPQFVMVPAVDIDLELAPEDGPGVKPPVRT